MKVVKPTMPPPAGEFPYTRGIHPNMYRARLWTMRQFSGFSSAQDTNARFRYLLSQGQTGLSVAFDLPTLMGYDADAPEALGEVGKCGVSVSTLADMEALFAGIPLAEVSVSMTINSPAPILYAMYLAVARKQGADWQAINGTLQNDILKEYIAQKEFLYPPLPSLKLAVDVIEFATRHTPRYNPISISGYHIREAGSTAVQELAYTLRNGVEYVEETLRRGLAIDEFAPRLSFFFNSHMDFFEEIAKFRAARALWASLLRDRYGAKSPKSHQLRFHAQTAGCSLTWQQPENNVVRTALQALAAVLGGAQSLHTNSLDEAFALPSEAAATLALRTQQILAYESGVTSAVDPVGGSEFVERLTEELQRQAWEEMTRVEALGGMVPALEQGYPQQQIAQASYAYQQRVERGEQVIVGVNRFQAEQDPEPPLLRIGDIGEEHVLRVKRERRRSEVDRTLAALYRVSVEGANTIPALVDCVEAYASVGEICAVWKKAFGEWREPTLAT